MIDLMSVSQALLVADQASFSGAAKILGVRQSAVSRRVRKLEDELGVSLFERRSDGVRPTDAGQLFLRRARAAFKELDGAVKGAMAAGRGTDGVIRIGLLPCLASGNLGILLGGYRVSHPGVAMELFEGSSQHQIGKIMDRSLDLAFVVGGTAAPGCDVETFWKARVFVALPERHPLAGCDVVDWALVKEEHFIFGREATSSGFDQLVFERTARLGGRASSETHEISQDAVMKLVALQFGLSVVGETSLFIQYPNVTLRRLPDDGGNLDYGAAWLPGNDNPALRRFLSLARSMSTEKPTSKA
jgi:DNA-binding transcriptional LysR family regulator